MARPAVFLDRDGTVIVDRNYLDNIEGVELLPGAAAGLRTLADLGFLLVLVTNQSGVGRGYFPESMVHAQYTRLQELLLAHGVQFAHLAYCPNAPEEACACRKPAPGMLVESARLLDLDLDASWMIGDKAADAEAGRAAGCRTIVIGPAGGDYQAADLVEAAAIVAAHTSR